MAEGDRIGHVPIAVMAARARGDPLRRGISQSDERAAKEGERHLGEGDSPSSRRDLPAYGAQAAGKDRAVGPAVFLASFYTTFTQGPQPRAADA